MANEDIIREAMVESAKQVAEDIYNDTIHPVAKNVGGFFGTFSGFFNHVVMYPLKKLNNKYEQKAIAFEREMAKKYNNIPEGNRVEPQLHIVGPTMESLKYNIMEDDIAEMYSNLLLSDLDKRTQSLCTPAIIKIIEQLSPVDARVFKNVYSRVIQTNALAICTIKFNLKSDPNRHYVINLPTYFCEVIDDTINDFDLSISIIHLYKLGLIEISFLQSLTEKGKYETLLQKQMIQSTLKQVKRETNGDVDVKIDEKGIIKINDFAKSFAKVCFREV